jgi:porphobilinogen synthase
MVSETTLSPRQMIYPFFVTEGKNKRISHPLVPGIVTVSVDRVEEICREVDAAGVLCVLLFGVVTKRDAQASGAFDEKGPVVQAIRLICEKFPHLQVATDIALDPYTDHGHDGLMKGDVIVNDETVVALQKMSLLHAQAGAQIVAPSDMMDGRVGAIRETLDSGQFTDTLILSYTAKYASALYGPFRDTLQVDLKGDKKSYQMNPANRVEASRELLLDLEEGADMVMVKPALWYLDVIADLAQQTDIPLVAYHVSGEAAMIEVGAKQNLFDRERAIYESLISIRRAGAQLIASYHALEVAQIVSLDRN